MTTSNWTTTAQTFNERGDIALQLQNIEEPHIDGWLILAAAARTGYDSPGVLISNHGDAPEVYPLYQAEFEVHFNRFSLRDYHNNEYEIQVPELDAQKNCEEFEGREH